MAHSALKTTQKPLGKTGLWPVLVPVAFILFWFAVLAVQLHDFGKFKGEMYNQVFPAFVSHALIYILPSAEICIAALMVQGSTRLAGVALSFLLMLAFTVYVGLALLNVYSRVPCSCAGLLGNNSNWGANFILNLCVTAVAAAGLIFTVKDRERRNKAMDTIVSHAPLTA